MCYIRENGLTKMCVFVQTAYKNVIIIIALKLGQIVSLLQKCEDWENEKPRESDRFSHPCP